MEMSHIIYIYSYQISSPVLTFKKGTFLIQKDWHEYNFEVEK